MNNTDPWEPTVNGGEETCAEVVIEILVLAHLKHFLPFLHGHLVLHALSCLTLLPKLLPSKLRERRGTKKQRATGSEFLSCFLSVDSKCPVNAYILYIHKAINISYSLCCDKRSHPWVGWGHMVSQEGQSVGEFSDTQSLEPLNAISLKALLPSHPATGFCPRAYKDEKSYSNMPEKHR